MPFHVDFESQNSLHYSIISVDGYLCLILFNITGFLSSAVVRIKGKTTQGIDIIISEWSL